MTQSTTRLIYGLCALAFVVIIARAYMNVKGTDALQPTLPQSQVQAFAKEQLDALQTRSFAENIELCGIIFETSEGELGASRKIGGDESTCDLSYFDEPGMVPVASFHTHGRFSRDYDTEVPSLTDIQSDIESGFDGYVSTPGGRLWHIDHEAQVANLVCGPNCMIQDARYEPCEDDVIPDRFTISQLADRFSGPSPSC
ncbi:hypothetical protein EH31_01165 [Erythrobacter longus]|uniref:DUF4329 domain-containing protein n=1 Tax=Erythrobacter longus TaxID=1044 RepID=A0A074M936_ERYLO|nr:DUF4329 domain-containing protein [Erythrobacter longus]KEO91301.1 hypothetical protein EH31_01165 [Erythrobacter longus]